jgi:hypothetical protein
LKISSSRSSQQIAGVIVFPSRDASRLSIHQTHMTVKLVELKPPLSMKALPEELLYNIVEYLAYRPERLALHLRPEHRFKKFSSHLRALSLTDRRLRRICLPFLFAYVHIENVDDAQKLKNLCTAGIIEPKLVK